MSNNISIYYFNNQRFSFDSCFKKATIWKIRTVQQQRKVNVSRDVDISYLKTINVLVSKAKQESFKNE